MNEPSALQLLRPTAALLPAYVEALQRGYAPSESRPAESISEELTAIAGDAERWLALCDDPHAEAPPPTLPDGTRRPRIPGLQRWLWDGDGFVGSMGLRWAADFGPLPAHVLGHIGYSVVPWKRRVGHATRGLALLLPLARARGLSFVEITTDPDNAASQRVITANGGVLVGPFDKGAAFGNAPGLRLRIELPAA